MSAKKSTFIYLAGVFFISTVIMGALFSPIAFEGNKYLFSNSGDGLKNYYTSAYYIKHDKGAFWTNSMNHPYGEHLSFADGQPAFSMFWRWIDRNIMDIDGHTVGLMNYFMLFSIVFSCCFLFLILIQYRLPPWYAIIVSLLIAFLSPQMVKMAGHYALSYLFVLPMNWYLLIRLMNPGSKKWVWLILLVFATFISSLLHIYFLLITVIFTASVLLIYLIRKKRERGNWKTNLIYIITAVVLPLIIFKLFTVWTDPFIDRPMHPWGFFNYRSFFETTFFEQHSEFLKTIKIKQFSWESYVYLGSLALVALSITLIRIFQKAIRKSKNLGLQDLPGHLNVFFWASLLVFLFANALPFNLGLEHWLDILYPLKQFRSLGRFTWILYYVFSVYSAVLFYQIFRRLRINRMQNLAVSFIIIVLLAWAIDGYTNTIRLRVHLDKPSESLNENKYEKILTENGYSNEDFQAILVLPIYNIGNEYLSFIRSSSSFSAAINLSYHTGISIIPPHLSRSSLERSFKILQLMSNTKIHKQYPSDLKSTKPILILATNENMEPHELHYINKAELIGQSGSIRLLELPLEALQDSSAHYFNQYETLKDSLTISGEFKSENGDGYLFYEGFGNGSEAGLTGKGQIFDKGLHLIYDEPIQADTFPIWIEASIWMQVNRQSSYFPRFEISVFDKTGLMTYKWDNRMNWNKIDIYKDWTRFSNHLKIDNPDDILHILIDGDQIMADEFMIRGLDNNFYLPVSDSLVFMNNFPLEKY